MKKTLFILIAVAAACVFQTGGFQTIAHAAWGEDILVSNYIPYDHSWTPSMDASPTGDLYVAMQRGGYCIDIYKSTDGGETWELLRRYSYDGDYTNPSLTYAQGSENWVFTTFERGEDLRERAVEVYRFVPSNPNNHYRTTIASGIYMPAGVRIHPEICTDTPYYDTNYYVYVTYSVEGLTYYPVYFSRSLDKGQTWTPPVEVTGYVGMSSGWQTQPDIAYGPSGLYIAFEKMGWNGSSWTNQIWVTKSTNWGTTWNTPIQVTTNSLFTYHPRIAVASNGTVMIAYTVDYEGGDLDIQSHYSTDEGTIWNFAGLPWTYGAEEEVELSVSTSYGRFHAAYWSPADIGNIWYSWVDVTNPGLGWSNPAIIVNELGKASHDFARPAVCPNPIVPVEQEACIAWTDLRDNPDYNVYFDHVSVCGDGWPSYGAEECDDGNTLNGDCCSATCTFESPVSPCSDGLFCDGDETCNGSGGCQPGPPPDCSDGIDCTMDVCDEGMDCCYIFPLDEFCNDGWFCNGDETCNPFTGCQPGSNPCPDDGLFCTGVEYCNEDTDGCGSAGNPCTPLLCDEITNTCSGSDFDSDGIPDSQDNCIYQYNPGQEDADSDVVGNACDNCPNHYNHYQEETYPPQGNGCGDACECEGNFNGGEDQDVDGTDAFTFKQDFGRSRILNPCTNADPCNGDFLCDNDVDGTDAFTFKSDFGRSNILNPCPYCVTIPWCSY